ncbi:MAG TPA: DUF4382 domain-containing protein [Chitinophagaceae bacterium]|nr:DUF4382 domain-containing protein [Chitinophagaceae bacterium]
MKTKILICTAIIITALVNFACQKESRSSTLRIRMTDAPTALEEVNVDLREINIKFQDDNSSWVSMNTKAGIYNLLGLQNGVDTLIGEGTYPEGSKVKEIRFVLGPNNSVKENGVVYPLVIPSGGESGLKIKFDKDLRKPLDSVLIDFDAALSVVKETSGYKLRPVLKIK